MGSDSRSLTVIFVDLSHYTTATEVHGDEIAVALATCLRDCLAALTEREHPVELVKSLGDGAMLVADQAKSALRLILRLDRRLMTQPLRLALHAGLAAGPVEHVRGDYFGGVVNVAARLTELARPGEAVICNTVALSAQAQGLRTIDLGLVALRGIAERIHAHRISLSHLPTVVDPVCGMQMHEATVARRTTHRGRSYAFCSVACSTAFATDPERYKTTG